MKKFAKWIPIIAILFLLIGCSKDTKTEKEKPSENQTKQAKLYTFPLTGLTTKEKPNHRAISVMMNNHPAARPQSGLTKADIVYEALAEGGVTRFLAVFQSEYPDIVGPIRSARPYYIELAKGLDAIYICHGWSPEAKEMITNGYIDALNGLFYDGTLFNRVSFRKAPHNSYISLDHMEEGIEENQYSLIGPPASFAFLKDGEDTDGEEQSTVTISYSTKNFEVRYAYDETMKAYKRFSGDVQTSDYDTDEPVLLNNIIIVEMNHTKIDTYGRLNIDIHSGGRGYLLQNGKMKSVTWENENGEIVPYINGKEAPLVPGKTWVNIVPNLDETVQL